MFEPTNEDKAKALALRISDECINREESPEDAEKLYDVLEYLFRKHPAECNDLFGTSIIEEDYFDGLS